ncbi:MAG: HEAT repeat domain-containing protein [Planctomycetaceae bacterium]|nr:HEAT repeat domain-containing protein [Planctomycetaceae bacterium]
MFGWFRPRCPLELREKVWVEYWTRWLIDQLGLERIRKAPVVLPTLQYFPDPYDVTPASIERVFRRVCQYLDIDPDRIPLRYHDALEHPGVLGHYVQGDPPTISLSNEIFHDKENLIAVMAHELGHEVLLGGKLLTSEHPEHEPITDLVVVLLGLGVFPANTAVKDKTVRMGHVSWNSISSQGYLPARMLGYAMAIVSWIREDESVPWLWALQPDAAHGLKGGLKFLRKTGDCLFERDKLSGHLSTPDDARVLSDLISGTDTKTLAALWDLADRPMLRERAVEGLFRCLGHQQPDIRSMAIELLPAISLPESLIRRLVSCLTDSSAKVRRAAAEVIGRKMIPGDRECDNGLTVINNLTLLLREDNVQTNRVAATALGLYGPAARKASEDRLLDLVAQGIVGAGVVQNYLDALEAMGVDVEKASIERYEHSNPGRLEQIRYELIRRRDDARREEHARKKAKKGR